MVIKQLLSLHRSVDSVGFQKNDLSYLSYLLFSNIYSTASWFLNAPGLTSLQSFCKSSAFPEIFCVECYEICGQYQNVCKLYTCGVWISATVGDHVLVASATICGIPS